MIFLVSMALIELLLHTSFFGYVNKYTDILPILTLGNNNISSQVQWQGEVWLRESNYIYWQHRYLYTMPCESIVASSNTPGATLAARDPTVDDHD